MAQREALRGASDNAGRLLAGIAANIAAKRCIAYGNR